MARKTVMRQVPALGKLASGFSGFRKGEPPGGALLELLRKACLKYRLNEATIFYSIREVADYFGVTTTTVGQVYKQLESEGLLNRIRGSRTMLQGTTGNRSLTVRGLVATPVSMASFLTEQNYRCFFLHLRRALRLNGFASTLAFYEEREAAHPEFADRLRDYQADTVIWFLPAFDIRQTAAILNDRGIRSILVGETWTSRPAELHYRMDWETGLANAVKGWKKAGLESVVIARGREDSPNHVLEVESTLREHKMLYSFAEFSKDDPDRYLAGLSRHDSGGLIFAGAALPARLGCRAPDQLLDLLKARRVLFVRGPVTMPFTKPSVVPVDLLLHDWDAIAKKVVADLGVPAFSAKGTTTVFEARWLSRVPLSEHTQNISGF